MIEFAEFFEEWQFSDTPIQEKINVGLERLSAEIRAFEQKMGTEFKVYLEHVKNRPHEDKTSEDKHALRLEQMERILVDLGIKVARNDQAESTSFPKNSIDGALVDDGDSIQESDDDEDWSLSPDHSAGPAPSGPTRPVAAPRQETPTKPEIILTEQQVQEAPAAVAEPAREGFFKRLVKNPVTWFAALGAANVGAIGGHELLYGDVSKIAKAPAPVLMGAVTAVLAAIYGVTALMRRSELKKHAEYLVKKDKELANESGLRDQETLQDVVDYLAERFTILTKDCKTYEAKIKNILEELSKTEYTTARAELLEKKDLLHKVFEQCPLEDDVIIAFPEMFEVAETFFVMSKLETLVQPEQQNSQNRIYENDNTRKQLVYDMCVESQLFKEKLELIFTNKEVYERFEERAFDFEKNQKQKVMPKLLPKVRDDCKEFFQGNWDFKK